MNKLQIMCTGEIKVDFHTLKDLQLTEDGRKLKQTDDEKINKLVNSLREFGIVNNLQVWKKGKDIYCFDAHHRKLAFGILEKEGLEIPLLPATRCLAKTKAEAKKLLILKESSNSWIDEDVIEDYLKELDFDLDLAKLTIEIPYFEWPEEEMENKNDGDKTPPEPETVVIKRGDLIEMGDHRVLCGDSIIPADVEKLMNGEKPTLLHADPPYGMGKEKDGVENDNLYRDKLDKFQMKWWACYRKYLEDNASAYIWGNSPDLWRLWYRSLECTEHLELRNEIVWDKKSIPGMKSDLMTQYPIATERCLFIQIGQQFIGNINSEDYPEEYEVVRGYLAEQVESSGVRPKDIKTICNCQMYSHWFTKSQFTLISEKNYILIQNAYPMHFRKPYHELKFEWDRVKGHGREFVNERHGDIRSYFDNAHDIMRDVWDFPRVVGDDRWEHATPKPVEMMERVIMSSCPKNKIVAEPFAGSGSTLIAAEKTGRRCFTMELTEKYVQTTVQRWCDYTSKTDIKINGQEVNWNEFKIVKN